jgi:hypothetical protein
MAQNKHLYLKNEVTANDGFKKTRNMQSNDSDEPETEVSKFPNQAQQDRLRRANAIFYTERKQRNEHRTIAVPAVIDIIVIKFYKVFSDDLKKEFYKRYGIIVSYYEDFNRTISFETTDSALFLVFIQHLELFYSSDLTETYHGKPYNLIALIHDFRFLTGRRRIKSYAGGISSISFIPPQNDKSLTIYNYLLAHLRERNKAIYQTTLTAEIIDVADLSQEDIESIVNNFDVVKTVTSTRTERRRPGVYGEERRDYGFTITAADNLPIVGVIDTGLYRIEPLRPCITDISFDLTNTTAYWDASGHGTSVACLVALGQEFITEIKSAYAAKAKIAIIKAIENDSDNLNIVQLAETIKSAYDNHSIRLFNLSLNDPMPKGYNKAFSDYAYILDKLAYENDILIFISVGNISEQRLRELLIDEPHAAHEYPNIFYSLDGGSDIHTCETTNISEPAESLNNISIGALAGNLERGVTSDITPAEEYPAYYTRKFHYDYEQLINGSEFTRSQKNKHLNKPDIVFDGGDLFRYDAGMEILRSPTDPSGMRYFSKSCGTSLATPLVTSMAAEILTQYSAFRTQTVKALLINCSCPPIGSNATPPPAFRGFAINLFRKLVGFGRPNQNVITYSDDNSVTFAIESDIELEELQTIILTLPSYINNSGNKLNFKGTLCYSFLPIKENHLDYLPLQITFGIFKPIEANQMGTMKTEDYRIKAGMSWSEDFFGVENRLFSNVQHIDENVSAAQIEAIGNKVSIAIKCTGKKEIPDSHRKHLVDTKHKFSIILTITELPASRASNRLYNDIIAINTVQAIAEAEGEAFAEAEAE